MIVVYALVRKSKPRLKNLALAPRAELVPLKLFGVPMLEFKMKKVG